MPKIKSKNDKSVKTEPNKIPAIDKIKRILHLGVRKSLTGCKAALRDYGYIDHTVVFLSGKGVKPDVHIYHMTIDSSEDKEPLVEELRRRAKQHAAWGYILATETWLTTVEDNKPEQTQEALVVAGVSRGYHCCTAAIFERKPDGIVFVLEIPIQSDGQLLGLFTTLLAEPSSPEVDHVE